MDKENNSSYFEKGVNEFKKGNYDQAEIEFKNDKSYFLSLDPYKFYYKEKGNYYLAFMYYYGVGKKVDYEKAWKEAHDIHVGGGHNMDIWEEHISSGIIAKFIVAKMFYYGNYVEKDIMSSFKLFKSIADEWKIEEEIKNNYLFQLLLNEYDDIDAKYVIALINFYKWKYKKDENAKDKAHTILHQLIIEHNHILAQNLEKELNELN